jgi:exopolyphosphatase/guanosine-5'-triphosphate,3'-diphosphate pyrophosphatase
MRRLRRMTLKERYDVPKLNRGRADIIIGGGAVAEALMAIFRIERISISRFGLKEGMQTDYLLSRGEKEFDVKRSSVFSLANRCHYDAEHTGEVRTETLRLFDAMKEIGMHRMNSEQRRLLEYACILHDVGEFINYTKHHIHSYTIITNSAMFGFDDEELESMALMAKFHHRRFPDLRDKDLRVMRKKTAVSTLKCAMILKMADILDRHRTRSVKDVKAEIKNGDMVLTLISGDDIRMEIWSLEAAAPDFKKVFGLGLKIESEGYKQ